MQGKVYAFFIFISLSIISKGVSSQNSNAKIQDTALIKFAAKYTPKDTALVYTFLLKLYEENRPVAKFKLTKDKNILVVDTANYYMPYNRDSLFSGSKIKRVEIIKSDSFGEDTQIIKTQLILPQKTNLAISDNFIKDSLLNLRKKLFENSLSITYINEVEYGNNFYQGLKNTQTPIINNRIIVDAKLLGIPINISTNYSNFRMDNSLNFSDINLSMDIMKFKTDLMVNNKLFSKQLEKLNLNKKLSIIEMSDLDREIDSMESKLNNPYNIEKYSQNVKRKTITKADSLYKNKMDSIKINQIDFDIAAYDKDKIKLQKLKELRNFKKKSFENLDADIYSEKGKLLSGKNIRKNLPTYSKLSKGIGWIYSLNKFDIGKIAPIYSEYTLNGLTYLGLNTEFKLNQTTVSLTAGRLNNFSSYLSSINNNLGGYIYGAKLLFNRPTSNKFISLLYYDPQNTETEVTLNKYLIIGIGSKEQIMQNMSLNWEIAYSETDSSNQTKLKSSKLFEKFNPYALAANVNLTGDINTKIKFELSSKYVGFDFKNPASLNLRNDFLRNSLKLNRQFMDGKIQLTYQVKYDLDNFTSLKATSTKILNNNILLNYRITKKYKLNLNLNHTKVYNKIETAVIGDNQFEFESKLLNASIIQAVKGKSIFSTSILNVNINQTNSNTTSNLIHQTTFNNLLDIYKIGFKINSTLGYQVSQSDTSFGINGSIDFQKNFKKIQLNIGYDFKRTSDYFEYESLKTGFGILNKFYLFKINLEYYKLNNMFDFNNEYKQGLIVKTQLMYKF